MSPQRRPGEERDDATNDDMFYNGDDLDYDVDDMIDDQAQYGLTQQEAGVTQHSSDNLCNSPDITSKHVKSLRHAATIAASSTDKQLLDTENRSRGKV